MKYLISNPDISVKFHQTFYGANSPPTPKNTEIATSVCGSSIMRQNRSLYWDKEDPYCIPSWSIRLKV